MTNTELTLNIAQTAVLMRENLNDAEYETLYDAIKKKQAGFPELAYRIAEYAMHFDDTVPDQGETYAYIEALEDYTSSIVKHVRKSEDFPTDAELTQFVNKAVKSNS